MSPPIINARYRDALVYAMNLHGDQNRKGGNIPYFSHLIGVSSLILKAGGNEDQAIAGLLHDAIEDQGHKTSYEELSKMFGEKVASYVEFCTDETAVSRKKLSWFQRKKVYLQCLSQPIPEARIVVICDKLDNIRDMSAEHFAYGECFWERFTEKKPGTMWFLHRVYLQFKKWEGGPANTLSPVASRYIDEFGNRLAKLGNSTLPLPYD